MKVRINLCIKAIWRLRAIWIRGLTCLCVGLGIYSMDHARNYDARLRLRGPVLKENPVTLILISPAEWSRLSRDDNNLVRPMKEISSFTDGYFWHEETWLLLLKQILLSNPKVVGVSLFFSRPSDDEVQALNENENETADPSRLAIFRDKRVFWASRLESDGRVAKSRFASSYSRNSGLVALAADADGIVRRLPPAIADSPMMPLRLAQKSASDSYVPVAAEGAFINFQGPEKTFPTYSLTQLMQGKVPNSALRNRIVVIGAIDTAEHSILTPVGPLPRAEVIANIAENAIHENWIKEASWGMIALILLILLVASVYVIFGYPQPVALVLLVILAGLSISSSLWVFDNLNIWTPILAPLVQTVVTFVIFQSFQLAEKSQQTWELEQEKKLLMEMEAMKNNFMSLVSHDLKTPLAKIQAVLETRLRTSDQSDITNDYSKLSAYTQELHRYIQAILQASRAEAQAFKLNLQAVDINEVVSRACRECMALVKERQVQFREELEPQFSVEVDPTLIYEVVLNLIENAVKYTPEGGSITVRTEEIDNFVVVTVVDSGEGIDPSEQTSVWNKFYRGKRHEIVTKGTGLGLYLVRYFVELHGGQVFLESQPGKGTRIGFRLPIADAAHGTENEMKE